MERGKYVMLERQKHGGGMESFDFEFISEATFLATEKLRSLLNQFESLRREIANESEEGFEKTIRGLIESTKFRTDKCYLKYLLKTIQQHKKA